MSRTLGWLGMTAGGWAGWWAGAHAGTMAALVLGMVGTGAGLYYGRRLAGG
ncbi:MAG: hypothetical protein AB1941_22655 [Gemmatimonadota bacterium]